MREILFERISTVSKKMKTKELSPVELTKASLDRIKKLDVHLRSFITVMEEEALEQAKEREMEIATGKYRGPLHGIPISVKDMIKTKGVRTTGGSKVFSEWIPDDDATVVKKLYEAGAVIVGKANLHEFAMGATTENPHYGSTKNPWNDTLIPGGSSGGSAVNTAVGMVYGSIGTDTAGSVRLPAAMCGTVGIKPTYGLVSREGGIPFSWSLDHVGPMTRTVEDAAIILDVIKGYDPKDHTSVDRDISVMVDKQLDNLEGVVLGFHESYMFDGIDDEIKNLMIKAFKAFEQLGAEIVEIDLPYIDEGLQALRTIAQSEVYAFHKPMLEKYADDYGDDLAYRFHYGQDVTTEQYIDAQRMRKLFVEKTIEQMKGIDALIGPTNVQPPFKRDTMVPEMAISNMFTLGKTPLANVLGFPSLAFACGYTKANLPVGMQLIGKPFAERTILQIGDLYERSEPWMGRLKQNTLYEQYSV